MNTNNATVAERIDLHGKIIWLPQLDAASAIGLRDRIMTLIADSRDWDECAQLLDMHGFTLMLNVEYHGPQDYRRWSLAVRPRTWAAARIAELAA